jgi:2-oxoisovalerate dehydrogenase E1 component
MKKITKQQLIDFEQMIKGCWERAEVPYPIHFSGGNEDQLLQIFQEIKEEDYIFSTHRPHYHYLLKGGEPKNLKDMILRGDSQHVYDKKINFLSSSIVAGGVCIAAGVAEALKRKRSNQHVWCFLGDGAEEEGHFYEAVRYVDGQKLPCTFVIEDNDLSIATPKKERYNNLEFNWPSCVRRYYYTPTHPHVGTGKWVDFSGIKVGTTFG